MHAHIHMMVKAKPLTEVWTHTCSTHKHAFIYAYACSMYAYVWCMQYLWKGPPGFRRLILQWVSLKLSDCISWQMALWSETHTHLPQNLNGIDTDHNGAKWKLNWTEMSQIDSESRGRTCFREVTQTPAQNNKMKNALRHRRLSHSSGIKNPPKKQHHALISDIWYQTTDICLCKVLENNCEEIPVHNT